MKPWIALTALMILAGCDDHVHRQTEQGDHAVAQVPTSHPATLAVTWIVPGQPPETTQTAFTSLDKCDAARSAALAAGEETRQQIRTQNAADSADASIEIQNSEAEAQTRGTIITGLSPAQERKLRGVPLPTVSAVCLAQ